ncbi:hypothetical protein [Streptacidiphilus neutrinimicus]|uniref:hypothetical protein n=1 Tax=Streptacidiphilus neutrinimicus TaxID=105420 RepID=UPI0005A60C19|nr:hypothetical protein [Streptacidiphilus neutrinimicus]
MARYGPPDFRIISYAGNAEDVVLMRAFADTVAGFFVDVRAGEPDSGSNLPFGQHAPRRPEHWHASADQQRLRLLFGRHAGAERFLDSNYHDTERRELGDRPIRPRLVDVVAAGVLATVDQRT